MIVNLIAKLQPLVLFPPISSVSPLVSALRLIMELFSGLPWEIGRECLLRVPYKSHYNLMAVCRAWEAVVNSPRFYEDRRKLGTCEQSICLIQAAVVPVDAESLNVDEKREIRPPFYRVTVYDPLQGTWERLPHLPNFPVHGIPLFCECVCVNQKLVLIGGWHPSKWEATKTVFIYDFLSAKWSRGADMPAVRSLCACSVSPQGLVYLAGGHDEEKNALRGAAVYNLARDEWKLLPDMHEERDECYGVFIDNKFLVISGYKTEAQGRFERSAEIYDPNRGAWTTLENMWTAGKSPRSICVAASSSGRLYSFHKDGVREYNHNKNLWRIVCSLPEAFAIRITCCVASRDRIFVSGYARSTGGDQVICYTFEPPTPVNGAGPEAGTCGKWVQIEKPENFRGFVQSAVALEI